MTTRELIDERIRLQEAIKAATREAARTVAAAHGALARFDAKHPEVRNEVRSEDP